jgi:hypothetical protein
MATPDYKIYPLDDVPVLDATSDLPELMTVNVTAHCSALDDAPLAIDIPGRCRLLMSVDLADALCTLIQRAKGDALLAALRAGESEAVH